MLFKDRVYAEIAAMHDVGDVFAADILYRTSCCKGYLTKYHGKIEEIMNNLEKVDSMTAGDDSFMAKFWHLSWIFFVQHTVLLPSKTD